jgi:2-desacetyl-2-hydroxyethyl bacteriochlorophyllide A dehydrogenase
MRTGPDLMRAATLAAPRTFEVRKVPIPGLLPGHVRLRIEGTGVCGSNLDAWQGKPWFHYPFDPGASGHEGWGTIDAVGEGADGFRPGERVAALTSKAFAEFDVVPAASVVRLPSALDGVPCPGEALGCALAVLRKSRIAAGETIAVLGVGFLGAVLVQLASRQGARVLAVSRRECSRDVARSMGAAETIALEGGGDPVETIAALTEGRLCDCVIEATGKQGPLDLAGRLAREGGRLVIAGYHQDGPRRVDMQLWNWRALEIVNAHERDPAKNMGAMAAAIDLVASGRLEPASLYTHRYPLEDINEAFHALSERPEGFLKALIVRGA